MHNNILIKNLIKKQLQLVQSVKQKKNNFLFVNYNRYLTVSSLINCLDKSNYNKIIIRVNQELYDPVKHNTLVVNKYRIRQELINQTFNHRLVNYYNNYEQVLSLNTNNLFDDNQIDGYVLNLIISIKTKY